jgi:hypothetical protein
MNLWGALALVYHLTSRCDGGEATSMKSPFLDSLALLAVTAAAQQGPTSPLRHRTTAEDLQLFSQVLNQIRVNHPDSIDLHDLFMAAIEAMVHAADPHSYVLAAARLAPAVDTACARRAPLSGTD